MSGFISKPVTIWQFLEKIHCLPGFTKYGNNKKDRMRRPHIAPVTADLCSHISYCFFWSGMGLDRSVSVLRLILMLTGPIKFALHKNKLSMSQLMI